MLKLQKFGQRALSLSISEKAVCILLAVVLVVLLVPLLWLGRYDVPCYDDYSFAGPIANALKEGASPFAVIGTVLDAVKDRYCTVQGTFSGLLLMFCTPLGFGEAFYALTPWIILPMLCVCTLVFFSTLFERVFGFNRFAALIPALVTLMLQIELVPDAAQSFYWFNGAIYYSFMYALSLLLYSLLIRIITAPPEHGCTGMLVVIGLLAVVQGGGNFPSALVTALVFAVLLAGAALTKKIYVLWRLLAPAILFYGAFAFSLLSPGNGKRIDTYTVKPSLAETPGMVLRFMFSDVEKWVGLPVLLLLAMVTPFVWKAARSSRFTFPLPGLVWLFSAGFYAAMYVPTAYTEHSAGPKRLYDIIFYAFMLLIAVDWCYLVGWAAKRVSGETSKAHRPAGVSLVYCICLAGVFGLMTLSVGNTHLTGNEPVYTFTSLEAVYSLRSGEAAAYHGEYLERLEKLQDPTVDAVELNPYSVKPRLLFVEDRPATMAEFYGKTLIPEE